MKSIFIVARYKEDVDWVKPYPHFIVQKEEHLPNVGREPSSYLWYIIEHYDKLEGIYFFVQGNPFDHWPNVLEEVNRAEPGFHWHGRLHKQDWWHSMSNGQPYDSGFDIDAMLTKLGLETSESYMFKPGCQFIIDAETIKKKPKEFYIKAKELVEIEPRGPWAFERIVDRIFK